MKFGISGFGSLAVAAAALLLATALPQAVAAGFTYRYVDEQGVTHIGYSVPAEFVAYGYEVLNDRGRVVEVVLPKSELDARAAQMLRAAEERHQRELQRTKDEALLRFYSSTADIERVRNRKLAEFDNFIQIQERNIVGYQDKIKALQSQAATMERRGQQVPADILENLETLEHNIEDAQATIVAKKREKEEVHAAYQEDISRLEFLMTSQENTSQAADSNTRP